jgi:DNA-binding transcriptional LysR family regulator
MNLSTFALNLLLALDAVLAERSVTRAAHRLHVTPSAISYSLARLRSIMKDPLVVKSGRGIAPTPRAAALGPALGRALQDLDRTVHGDVFDARTTNRQFTLAIADAGQVVRVPRLVSAFAKEMPLARLRIVGIDTLLSSGGLSGTEVDVAVVGVAEAGPGLHAIPLYNEHTVLVARRGHAMAGARISKANLAAVRHVDVHVAPGHGFQALVSAHARLGINRNVALVVPNFTAAAAVVAQTDFVATLPESFVDRFADSFRICKLAGSVPRLSVAIQLAWHERTDHDPSMQAFRALVVRTMGRMSDRVRQR